MQIATVKAEATTTTGLQHTTYTPPLKYSMFIQTD